MRFVLALSFLTTLLAGSLRAQGAADSTRADTVRLVPVVVTATRVPAGADAAPSAVTVITGAEMARRGITTVAEALRLVPGAALARSGSTGGTTTLFLRGGERDYVKVLVDGVAANDPGGDFDFAHLSTANIDRIEVVRGPASVLYGSDAVTGVVQLFTRAGERRALRAAVRAGERGTREGEADVATPLCRASECGTISVAASRTVTDGILPLNNGYRNTNAGGRLDVRLPRRGLARLTLRSADGTFHFPTDGVGAVTDSNQFTSERRLTAGAELAQPLGARLTAHVQAGAMELDRLSENAPDSPGDSADFYYRSDGSASRRALDLRLDAALPAGATVSLGAAYERERERSDGTATFGTFPLEPTRFDEARITRAAYAQLLAVPSGRLAFTAGGRVDRNSRFGTFATARVAASYAPHSGTRLRAAIGNAFKAPAFGETFNTAFSIGAANLVPERSQSREIGVEQRLAGGRAHLGVTAFDQRFRDLVQYLYIDRTQDPDSPNYMNIGGASSRGVELEARLTPTAAVDVTAGVTWLRTRVTDEGTGAGGTFEEGERLLRRPGRTASLALSLRPARALTLSAASTWIGERDDRDFAAGARVTLPGYALLDLAADYALPLRRGPTIALTARVENALDRRYQSVLGFDAPGRLAIVGLRVEVVR